MKFVGCVLWLILGIGAATKLANYGAIEPGGTEMVPAQIISDQLATELKPMQDIDDPEDRLSLIRAAMNVSLLVTAVRIVAHITALMSLIFVANAMHSTCRRYLSQSEMEMFSVLAIFLMAVNGGFSLFRAIKENTEQNRVNIPYTLSFFNRLDLLTILPFAIELIGFIVPFGPAGFLLEDVCSFADVMEQQPGIRALWMGLELGSSLLLAIMLLIMFKVFASDGFLTKYLLSRENAYLKL